MFDEDSCKRHGHCVWNEAALKCAREGHRLPCKAFHSDEACSAHKDPPENCTWDAIVHACLPAGTEAVCERHFTQRNCETRDYCHWFHNRCHHVDKKRVNCAEIETEHECLHYACLWEDNTCSTPPEEEMPERPSIPIANKRAVLEELRKPRDLPNCNNVGCEDAPTGCEKGQTLAKHT